MTRTQRVISIALSGVLLISGFALGRLTDSSGAKAAGESQNVAANTAPGAAAPGAKSEGEAFYLTDYKAGYSEGYNQGLTGQGTGTVNSTREGYNAGFREGFGDGYQARLQPQTARYSASGINAVAQPISYRPGRTRVVYRERPVYYERRHRGSKLRTALTIAAPAAIGAGIGALAGGGKGAGVGALIGGGGGALYHLYRTRH
ncbi:MAG TPA: hypothetical protein VFD58_08665 [Blastocatellia bacterium]|nr:hypothetical protein [Blastocatellia bacterium]